MIVKSYDFERKVDYLCKNHFFLFYGENFGKSSDVSKKLIQNIIRNDGSFNTVLNFDQNHIESNSDLLNHNILSGDLFGDKKIIVFNIAETSSFKKIFKYELLKKIESVKIIVKCFELDKRNYLRSLFEKEEKLIVIPCYEDTIFEKVYILDKVLDEEKLQLTQEQRVLLTETSYKDRNIFKQNIEKALLFKKNAKEMTTEDLNSMINSDNLYELSKFVLKVFSKGNFNLEIEFENILKQGINEVTILNRISYHVQRLLITKHRSHNDLNIKAAIKKLKPPVFFKEEDQIICQIKKWSLSSLENIVIELLKLESSIKGDCTSIKTEVKFLLIKIHKYARDSGI